MYGHDDTSQSHDIHPTRKFLVVVTVGGSTNSGLSSFHPNLTLKSSFSPHSAHTRNMQDPPSARPCNRVRDISRTPESRSRLPVRFQSPRCRSGHYPVRGGRALYPLQQMELLHRRRQAGLYQGQEVLRWLLARDVPQSEASRRSVLSRFHICRLPG